MQYKSLITARQVVCVAANKQLFKLAGDMANLHIIENGAVVIGVDGKIVQVGAADAIKEKYIHDTFESYLDYPEQSIIPGFVDAHTHPVWAGDRVNEFKLKLAGATYMDIHKQGGGIGFTVKHTKEASEDQLLSLFNQRLDGMLSTGTTLVEAKSGYGLELDTEVKMLRVIQRAEETHTVDIVANYCGAHSVPKGKTADEAVDDIVNNQLPVIAQLKCEGVINPEQIDVFCETGVFNQEQSRKILTAGQQHGLSVNFHGDELTHTASCEMGGEIGASAISHVECVSDEGVKAMADNKVAAVLLPTTAYVLRIHPPPARKLIDEGVIVALGSDFNPNAYCWSMPHVMNLACVTMRMTVEESLTAATINSAKALNKSAMFGSIEEGKWGDLVVVDAPQWEHIVYQIGIPPIKAVIKKGAVVHSK